MGVLFIFIANLFKLHPFIPSPNFPCSPHLKLYPRCLKTDASRFPLSMLFQYVSSYEYGA